VCGGVSLGRGRRVWRRAITGSSRRGTAGGGRRGCGGRLLLIVLLLLLLLSMRRLGCHCGHYQWVGGADSWCGWGLAVGYVIGPKLRWQDLWAEAQLAVLSCRMGSGGRGVAAGGRNWPNRRLGQGRAADLNLGREQLGRDRPRRRWRGEGADTRDCWRGALHMRVQCVGSEGADWGARRSAVVQVSRR
jgi:hypothetical protein